MRIGLNLLHVRPAAGGAWNYIKNTVSLLEKFDHENEYVVYCSTDSACLVNDQPNFRKVKITIYGGSQIYRIFYENTILQLRAIKDYIDIMHWFANTQALFNAKPSIVTVHDLLVFHDPGAYSALKRVYYRFMIAQTVKNACFLTSISESTARDLSSQFSVDNNRMGVVCNPLHEDFVPATPDKVSRFREKYRLPRKFWLYVAHYYPHKNHQRLFSAYAELKSQQPSSWPLVLCGEKNRANEFIERLLKESGIVNHVIWLPRLTDSEMPVLFTSATALVFPSIFEGGGIPVMEAMACGCPVLASDIPTTREFAGDAALLFSPFDVQSISKAMQSFQRDSSIREKCRQRGLKKVENYRPQRVFGALINAYQTAYDLSDCKN